MAAPDRLGDVVRNAVDTGPRALVSYLTLGDPLTPPDLVETAVSAGTDILEFGFPTPGTRPRGAEVRDSFRRADGCPPARVWQQLTQVRRRLPDTPVVLLVYPETVADLGWPDLIAGSLGTGVDGLVLTGAGTGELERVAAAGLSAIPLVRPGTPRSEADRLERVAAHLTYRPLAGRTGDPLDLSAAARAVAELAATAVRPFLVGFGIRSPQEVRRLARHAAGVVVGSHLLQVVGAAEADRRAEVLRRYLGAIKAATTVARRGDDGTSRTTDGPQA